MTKLNCYRSAYSDYTTTLSVTSNDIVSLEHIVLTIILTLETMEQNTIMMTCMTIYMTVIITIMTKAKIV